VVSVTVNGTTLLLASRGTPSPFPSSLDKPHCVRKNRASPQ
jgi:hypothetical protein